ncbi:hypothetical protein ABIB40_000520 [Pedobacter sp. UYP30]|uniref:hypothetical protein n=1 Tax=Pedobacter sp. UYP30 TaxID=1756400 RepID=UPI00339421F0
MEVRKRKKFWLWTGSILGVIILVILVAALILSAKWKPLLTEKIKDGVYKGSHHLYIINFDKINLNLITGSLALHNVTLMPDTAVYDSLKVAKLAPANVFEIKLEKLQLTRISILKAYFDRKLDLSEIALKNPSIKMTHNKVPKKPDSVKNDSTLYQKIAKTLKSIHVGKIAIKDADFDYTNKAEPNNSSTSLKHVDINVDDFLLDSLSGQDSTRFFYTKDIGFQLLDYKSVSKDKMYTMKVDSIFGSTKSKEITISNFKMIPMFKELAFARKYKVQKDRYDLTFGRIQLKGVDFLGLSSDQKIMVKKVSLNHSKVYVFMSRESPPPPGLDKAKNFPHIALKKLKTPIKIDTIKIKDLDVTYSEYNPASKKIGSVSFKNSYGSILNVTNDSLMLEKNNHAVADLNTSLMGTSKLNLKINFNLTANDGAFSYSGSMGKFNMQGLNSLSVALGLVKIESGEVDKIYFDAKGNTESASGSLNMRYHNLKVELLSDNIDGKGTEKKGFLSFLANNLLVIDKNPKDGEAARTATMSNARIPSASFFNLMWKTVFVGIKDIVGVAIVPEKNPVKQQKVIAEKIKEQKQKDKAGKNKN